jgi:hypothetical protein
MPDKLQDGIIYVSQKYRVALHNCCCGCKEEVSTPLAPTEYRLTMSAGKASLWPSIGNHDFPCRSHYVIDNGEVVWSGEMSRETIEAGRRHDQFLKRGHKRRGLRALFAWVKEALGKLGR